MECRLCWMSFSARQSGERLFDPIGSNVNLVCRGIKPKGLVGKDILILLLVEPLAAFLEGGWWLPWLTRGIVGQPSSVGHEPPTLFVVSMLIDAGHQSF